MYDYLFHYFLNGIRYIEFPKETRNVKSYKDQLKINSIQNLIASRKNSNYSIINKWNKTTSALNDSNFKHSLLIPTQFTPT